VFDQQPFAAHRIEHLQQQRAPMSGGIGRPSIRIDRRIVRALLLQVLYTVRSERLLIEQLEYNLLFRWFVGLGLDEPIWNHRRFRKTRSAAARDIADASLPRSWARRAPMGCCRRTFHGRRDAAGGVGEPQEFRPKDEAPRAPGDPKNPAVNFPGERRRMTPRVDHDPDARLYRKATASPRDSSTWGRGGVLMENRSDSWSTHSHAATDTANATRPDHVEAVPGDRVTLGAQGLRRCGVLAELRHMMVTPTSPRTREPPERDRCAHHGHPGYGISQQKRKRVEEIFGWMKTIGLLRKLRHRGGGRVTWIFRFTAARSFGPHSHLVDASS